MTNNAHAIKFGTDGWRAVVGKDFNFENVEIVTKAIEPLRADKKVGSSLEVAVYIKSPDAELLKANEDELSNIYITSQAHVTEEKPSDVLNEYTENDTTVWVVKAQGEKCARCWKYAELNENGICKHCQDAINE